MSHLRRNGHWIVALLGAVSLAWSAGVLAQRQAAAPAAPAAAPEKASPEAVSRGIAGGHELSAAFAHVAKDALPGIVSIEVRGKAVTSRGQGGELEDNPFGNFGPFGDLFKNDPRFKEYFRQRPRGQAPRTQATASGFVIDPSGVILTNNHVVQDADQVKVKLHDGREFIAGDIKTDPRSDVAIIRVKDAGRLHALKMGNSDATEVGEWVLAVGSPFGLDLTVTAGIISAKGRGPGITEREDFLQTDAAINPGNSGGPLLNLNGEVIGINTAISSRSGGYEGIGFAVPINMARWVTDQLIAKGTVSRAYLGVAIQPVTSELAQQFNVPVGLGAVVTQVAADSPAAGAKLHPGDLIVKLDGKDVPSPRVLQGIVEQLKIGNKYPIVVLRNGKETTLTIEMKEMPKSYSIAEQEEERTPSKPSPGRQFDELGLGIEELTPDVARQLGYKNASGVLIGSVESDSPAAAAGLREGMVIERVGTKDVHTPAQFKDALKDVSLEKGILMLVRNQRGTQFVVIRPERPAATK